MLYNELIISSGGNKGIATLGALTFFSKYYPIYNFKYLTGCSFGAIICMFINIGYNMNEINEILFKINFKEFQDCKFINFLNTCGFDEGIKFSNFLKATILYKNYDSNITFKELYDKTGIFLTISVLNITKGITEYHNYITTPDLSVFISVRMSSNIPILFSPIIYNDNYYVDGAILDPFPFYYNKNTNKIGFWLFEPYEINFIKNAETVNFVNNSTDSFNYLFNLLKIIHVNYIKEYYKKIINTKLKNVILIDFEYKGITFENFDVKLEDKINVFNIGMKKCKLFLKKHNKSIRKKYLSNKYYHIWKNKTFHKIV
jgi:predicted patatin/cPLA2 family phospholipase